IGRILSQPTEARDSREGDTSTSVSDHSQDSCRTVLNYTFQCNHYEPGRAVDPAIMTAWALGPHDKAYVVARFLPELALWNGRSEQLWNDITRCMETRLLELLSRVKTLSQELA